jgi:hypothetical protein
VESDQCEEEINLS